MPFMLCMQSSILQAISEWSRAQYRSTATPFIYFLKSKQTLLKGIQGILQPEYKTPAKYNPMIYRTKTYRRQLKTPTVTSTKLVSHNTFQRVNTPFI